MRLVEQWRGIERGLPERWREARLSLTLEDERELDRAAALLGPLSPGRTPGGLRFMGRRGGGPASPESVRRLLHRLDREGIEGTTELVGVDESADRVDEKPELLAAAWDTALAGLPSDWSDLLAEIELRSTDHLDRAALLLAPLNPTRVGERPAFWFRCARRFGYGASPGMARRCLERCDEENISGRIAVLRALSDTRPVATQGPVWYVGGKAV